MQNKKRVMNIRPQEVTEGEERSLRYKGSDGKFHNVAPEPTPEYTPKSYAIENNPDAYELMLNGENYRGTPLYKAVTCDDAQTEITVAQFAQILKDDPKTTVIYNANPDNLSYSVIAILKVDQVTSDGRIRLTGEVSQNHGFNCVASVMVTENQIRLSTTQKS